MAKGQSSGDLCTICSQVVPKYKCPRCWAGYCSVKCSKIHKEEPCGAVPTQAVVKPKKNAGNSGEDDDDDEEEMYRLRPKDMQRLNDSGHVKELLRDPALRALLEAAHRDSNPVEAIHKLRQRPEFEALAQALISATSDC